MLGVVLSQPGEGNIDNFIAFTSHKLSKVEKNYTTMDKECIVSLDFHWKVKTLQECCRKNMWIKRTHTRNMTQNEVCVA